MTDRMQDMVERYGETCTQATAGRVLSRSRDTIRKMLEDGRLRRACGGSMVDVRSIAEYIERPQEMDRQARVRRKYQARGTELKWSV